MNKSIRILTVISVTILLFPILAQADPYLRDHGFRIKFPSFFLLSAIFVPVFVKEYFQKGLNDLTGIYLNTKFITLPFFLLSATSIVWGLLPGAGWQEGGGNMSGGGGNMSEGLRSILMDFYHWVLLMLSITVAQSRTVKEYHRIIFLIILAGAGTAVWIDYFHPGTFSKLTHRAAGFTSNSNDGAMVILFLCIAAVDWKKNELINLIVLAFSGLTIFATLSVGNLLLFLSVVLYYFFLIFKRRKKEHFLKTASWVAAIPLLIMFVIQPLLVNMMESSDSFNNRTSQARIDKLLKLFHGDFSFLEDHERKDLVEEYWKFIFESPIIGQGTAFSSTQADEGTHNMYLKHWVENGLLGLLIYLSLIAGVFWHFYTLRDKRGLILVFVLFLSGFHTHNLLQNRTVVLILGIFGTLAYLENSKKTSSVTLGKTSALQ